MMITRKAGQGERDAVIKWYKKEYELELNCIGRRKKYLEDPNGKKHCFLVGYEYWHGLGEGIWTNENSWQDGLLIIGVCNKDNITIYQAPLLPLLQKLKKGDTFNIRERENHLCINQIYDYKMKKIGEIQITEVLVQKTLREVIRKAETNPQLARKIQALVNT